MSSKIKYRPYVRPQKYRAAPRRRRRRPRRGRGVRGAVLMRHRHFSSNNIRRRARRRRAARRCCARQHITTTNKYNGIPNHRARAARVVQNARRHARAAQNSAAGNAAGGVFSRAAYQVITYHHTTAAVANGKTLRDNKTGNAYGAVTARYRFAGRK